MSYFGGKSGEGVYQQIINLIPPHKVFISAFLGHCAVLRKKRPAQINVGIDLDAGVINHWKSQITHVPTLSLYCVDALTWLDKCKLDSQSFLFCDPPYLHETRKSHSRYQYELTSVEHERLLEKLLILG